MTTAPQLLPPGPPPVPDHIDVTSDPLIKLATPESKLLRLARAVALAGVIAAAVALAVARAYLVPIFEASDENDHFDYAISIERAGHLLSAHNALGFPAADLESAFLETYADFPRVYLNADERAPLGPPAYGTHAYFDRIDTRSHAELPDPHARMNAPDHPNPVLISMYPFAYYALDAMWMSASDALRPSLVSTFFAARLFSPFLLALTLVLAYGLARELRVRRTVALALVAAAGTFPLTSFVAGYVQPDNLALLAVVATCYFAARLRRAQSLAAWVALACALGVLAVTKYQTALCVALAVAPMLAIELYHRTHRPLAVVLATCACAVPAALVLAVQTFAIGKNEAFAASLPTHFVFTGLANLSHDASRFGGLLLEALRYYYVGNVAPPLTHDYRYAAALSYWNYFDNLDTYAAYGPPPVARAVEFLVPVLTCAVGALTLWWLARTLLRLARLSLRRRPHVAIRLALGNATINAYLIFSAFMIVFYALTNNHWRQSGRNWFPFVFAAMLLAVHFAPRAIAARRARAAVAAALLIGLCAFSGFGSYYAALAVEHRYYGLADLPPLERMARGHAAGILIGHVGDLAVDVKPKPAPVLTQGATLAIEGLASDPDRRDAAGGVIARVDDRDEFAASYRYAHEDYATRLHNDKLFWAGFHVDIPTANLALGAHRVSFFIVSQDRTRAFRAAQTVRFELVTPGPARPAVISAAPLLGSLDKVVPIESANVDGPERDAAVFDRNGTMFLKGWLVDPALRSAVRGIDVVVDGRIRLAAHPGELRPELRADFPAIPPLVAAYGGFSAIVPLERLTPGPHRFSLEATRADESRRIVARDFPFEIRPSGGAGSALEPAPAAFPVSFGRRGDYRGSVDAIAPLRDLAYFNTATDPVWVARGEPLAVKGWGVDRVRERALQPIEVSVDGGPVRFARVGDLRPDVVLGLADVPRRATAGAGFNLTIATASMALGVHNVTVRTRDPRSGRVTIVVDRAPFTVY